MRFIVLSEERVNMLTSIYKQSRYYKRCCFPLSILSRKIC